MYTLQGSKQRERVAGRGFDYDQTSNDIIKHVVFELNKMRRQAKHKKLYRSKLGDTVAGNLHEQGIKVNDPNFARILEESGLISIDSDFLTLEMKVSNHQHQDVKQTFLQLLNESVSQSSNRARILTSNVYTHVSMALKQTGMNRDVFQIGVLMFKVDFTIEKVFESQQGEGAVIVGRVLDPSIKPCMAVLNRDDQNLRCVVGPNLVHYDPSDGDEYKIHVPNNYLRMARHPLLSCAQPLIEIYGTQTSNRQLKLANTMDVYEKQLDFDQNLDPLQMCRDGIQIGIRSFMVPQEDFKGLPTSNMEEALNPNTMLLESGNTNAKTSQISSMQSRMPTSLANRLSNKTASRTNVQTANNQAQPQIKKTRAQMLREQNAAASRANNNSFPGHQQSSFNNGNFQGTGSGIRDFSQRNNSQQSRFQPSYQSNSNPFQNSQTVNNAPRNALNCTFANSPMNASVATEHKTSVMQSAISQVNLTPRSTYARPSQQPVSWNRPQQISTAQPNQGIKFAFNSQQQQTQQQSNFQNSGFQSFQQPQQNQNQAPWQQNQSNFQPQFKVPCFASNQAQVAPTQTNTQFVQQPVFRPVVTQPVLEMPMQQDNGPVNIGNQTSQTPLPVRYAVNGTQSKRFDSKKSHQDTSLLPLRTQHELDQQKIEFYQMADSDQQYLKNCMEELIREFQVPQEELEGARKLMLTNPMQFYAFYQHAAEVSKAQETQTMKQEVHVEQKPLISVSDFSDTHLFLINFAEKQYNCSKYIDKPKNTKQVLQAVTDPENQMTAQEGLEQIILSREIPRNDGFAKLYGSKSEPPNLTLILHRQKYKCHQFVLSQSSGYMKDAMRKNQQLNMQQFGQSLGTISFELPEWVQPAALESYIKFSYTTEFKLTQTGSSAARRERPQEALDLFRLACYFHCYNLQECLLAREIFPNMNAFSAVLFLQELFDRDNFSPCKREPSDRVKAFLQDYCMFYLSKNLPVILRQEMSRLLKLPVQAIYELVQTSLYYIVDARADIEILIEFAANVFAEKDIFKLFNLFHDRMKSCCGFDQQHIPQIGQITKVDSQQIFSMELIQGFDYSSLKSNDEAVKAKSKLRDSCALDTSTVERITEKKSAQVEKQLDQSAALKQFGPSKNVLVFSDGQSDTGPIKDPSFILEMDLTEQSVSQYLGAQTPGLTFFSQAFDAARRSWHLKIDIAQPSGEISLWLVERGQPCTESDCLQVLRSSLPIQFTSQLMELQIVDPGLKDRKAVIFFSFSHSSNQIIGHQNFVNLSQLMNKDKIKVHVKIKEHILHSAMMQYFAQTFQRRFKEECALEQTIKMCGPHSQKVNTGLFAQPIYMPYWLLSSDTLKVEDENTVLSFIFHYSNLLKEKKGSQSNAVLAVDQLTKCLRFNFCDLHNLMSAIRKSPSIQNSSVMTDSFAKEVKERQKLKKPAALSRVFGQNNPVDATAPSEHPEEEHHFCGRARKYYDSSKVDGQARSKLIQSSKDSGLDLIDEITQWAFQSRINEISDQETRLNPYQMTNQHQYSNETAQVRVLNYQLTEEKQKVTRMAQELQDYQRKYQALLNDQQYSRPTTHHQPPQMQPMKRHESPPKYVPKSLDIFNDDKENKQQSKLGFVTNHVVNVQSVPQPPLYVKPQEQPDSVRRDPPMMLGGRREPPGTLANKALSQRSFHSDQLLNNSLLKHDPTKVKPPASLNLSTQTGNNGAGRRQPPSSLAGGNKSMDLSQIMNQINASPAPQAMRRKPGAAVNQYLAKKNGDKENCTIF